MAPKAYYTYLSGDDEEIIKHKGAGKAMAEREWFETMLEDPELKKTYTYEKKFHQNWRELLVQYREFCITMGLNSKKWKMTLTSTVGKSSFPEWIQS